MEIMGGGDWEDSSNNNNNNNIYSGSSTHRSVFQGGPVIYIYIIDCELYILGLFKNYKLFTIIYYMAKVNAAR